MYSTGNSTQYSVMAYTGKESKKEWIYEVGQKVRSVNEYVVQ